MLKPMTVDSDLTHSTLDQILAWLDFAQERISSTFTGWADSDTWLQPIRLHAFLQGVTRSLGTAEASSAWVGMFMHWTRYSPSHLDGFGYMHDSSASQERIGFELKLDHARNRLSLAQHQSLLRGTAEDRRR